VHGDRAFLDDVAEEALRRLERGAEADAVAGDRADAADAVDVTLQKCPPSGSPARRAGSRFTSASTVRPPSVVRASVSGTAVNAMRPSATSVAVRSTPSIDTESPSAVRAAVSGPSMTRRVPSPPPSTDTTVPRSLTIPVNTSSG